MDKYLIPLIWRTQSGSVHRDRKWNGGFQALREGNFGSCCSPGGTGIVSAFLEGKLWRSVWLQCESTYHWAVHFKMATRVVLKKIILARPKSGTVMYWKGTGLWIRGLPSQSWLYRSFTGNDGGPLKSGKHQGWDRGNWPQITCEPPLLPPPGLSLPESGRTVVQLCNKEHLRLPC